MTRKLLTVREAADLLNISPRHVLDLFHAGDLKGTQLSPRIVRIYKDSIEELIAEGEK